MLMVYKKKDEIDPAVICGEREGGRGGGGEGGRWGGGVNVPCREDAEETCVCGLH